MLVVVIVVIVVVVFVVLVVVLVPKKVELLIRFFIFHFSLGTFEEVEHLPAPLRASDETYTQSKIDISGSNETIQNALALIVKHCAFNIIFLPLHDSLKR